MAALLAYQVGKSKSFRTAAVKDPGLRSSPFEDGRLYLEITRTEGKRKFGRGRGGGGGGSSKVARSPLDFYSGRHVLP